MSIDGGPVNSGGKCYKHQGFSTTITDSFSTPSYEPRGLAWDGSNVIIGDINTDKIYRMDGFSSTIDNSFSHNGDEHGLAWGSDSNLYSSGSQNDKIYKHSGFSSTITDSFDYSWGEVLGLAGTW